VRHMKSRLGSPHTFLTRIRRR